MPTLIYLHQNGLNLTEEWQAYAIIGFIVLCIIVSVVVVIRGRKW